MAQRLQNIAQFPTKNREIQTLTGILQKEFDNAYRQIVASNVAVAPSEGLYLAGTNTVGLNPVSSTEQGAMTPALYQRLIDLEIAQGGALTATRMAEWDSAYAHSISTGNPHGADLDDILVGAAVTVAQGGTGIQSYTVGDILYASGATTLSKLADVATGNVLISGGVGVAPSWGKVVLTTHVAGTLDATNGGTGMFLYNAGDVLYAATSTVLTVLNHPGSAGQFLKSGSGTSLTWGNVDVSSLDPGTFTAGTWAWANPSTITMNGTLAVTTWLHVGGGTPPTTGVIRIPNNSFIYWKNAVGVNPRGVGVNTIDYLETNALGLQFDGDVSGTLKITWPTTITSYTWTLPSAQGAANTVLKNDGSGNLAWSSATVPMGGTGITSYTVGDILYASGTTTLAKLADVATGNVLISGGVGVAPSWGKVFLTTHVSGTLGVGNGGTGLGTMVEGGRILYSTAADTLASLATGDPGQVLTMSGGFPVWSTLSFTAENIGAGTFPAGTWAFGATSTVTVNGTFVVTSVATIGGGTVPSTGTIRMANNRYLYWKNAAASGDLYWGVDAGDRIDSNLPRRFMNGYDFTETHFVFGWNHTGGDSTDKWVKVADFTLTGNYAHISTTLNLYPYQPPHGGSSEQITVAVRNNFDATSVETTEVLSHVIFGGTDSTRIVRDVNVVITAYGPTTGEIWIRAKASWLSYVAARTTHNGGGGVITWYKGQLTQYSAIPSTPLQQFYLNSFHYVLEEGLYYGTTAGTNRFVVSNAGLITTGTWNATTIAVGYGGTGLTSMTNAGRILYSASASELTTLAIGDPGQVLAVSGSSLPYWTTISTNAPDVGAGTFPSGTWAFAAGDTTVTINGSLTVTTTGVITSYLSVGGGTYSDSGVLRMANNKSITWRNFGNTDNQYLYVDPSNNWIFAAPTTKLTITSAGNVSAVGYLAAGTYFAGPGSVASVGILRLANNNSIAWRNAAGTGDLTLTCDTNNALAWNGEFYTSGWLQTYGTFYHRANFNVLNKAGTGWLTWATRNTAGSEVKVDLSNLGTLNMSGVLTSTVTTGTAPLTIASTTVVTNLNADLLDGYHASWSSGANTVVVRDASQYVYATYFNSNIGQEGTVATSYYFEGSSDNWIRKKSLANVKTEIVTTAAVNAAAATTVGTVTSGTWNAGVIPVAYGGTASSTRKAASGQVANFGQLEAHGTYSDFNAVQQWGGTFVMGTTNGPGTGETQFYQIMLSLGSNYDWGSGNVYAHQIAIGRNTATPYISVRSKEGGNNTSGWGSWSKIKAGYADTAGSATTATDADTVDGQHAAAFATATHYHSAADITSGVLTAARGGTTLASFTANSILYANTTSTLACTNAATNGTFLGMSGSVLSFQAVSVGAANVSPGTFQSGAFAFTTSAQSPIFYTSNYLAWYTGNVASNGMIRMLNNQYIGWRNAGNTANISLGVNTSDRLQMECGFDFGTSLGQIYGLYDTAMSSPATTYSHFRMGDSGCLWRDSASDFYFMHNAYFTSSGTWKYLRTGQYATRIDMNSSGGFLWLTAPSGTAGNDITFTSRMSLANSTGDFIVTGDVTAYGTPSDARLKSNVQRISNALDKVRLLNGYTFDWNDVSDHWRRLGTNDDRRDMGVIAQEVQLVLPFLVREKENGFLSVRTDRLIALLIEAVKEVDRKLDGKLAG